MAGGSAGLAAKLVYLAAEAFNLLPHLADQLQHFGRPAIPGTFIQPGAFAVARRGTRPQWTVAIALHTAWAGRISLAGCIPWPWPITFARRPLGSERPVAVARRARFAVQVCGLGTQFSRLIGEPGGIEVAGGLHQMMGAALQFALRSTGPGAISLARAAVARAAFKAGALAIARPRGPRPVTVARSTGPRPVTFSWPITFSSITLSWPVTLTSFTLVAFAFVVEIQRHGKWLGWASEVVVGRSGRAASQCHQGQTSERVPPASIPRGHRFISQRD